ncbi:MAG: helix-turn-helix domain-containing protein [Desulfovibrionaceae bacterium]|jgi:transcriptional regulator with XRE-family HTH domain
MEQAYKEIAPRLKGLRDALDMTVEEMAAAVGCEPGLVTTYEAGETEIPVGYLLKVSQMSGVGLTVLVSGSEAHLTSHSVVRAGKGLSVNRRKDYDYRDLAYAFKGRKMEPFEIRVPAKEVEDMHFTRHAGQEFIYMLEGVLELRLDEHVVVLNPGDSLYFDSQTSHALRGIGGEARFIDVIL